MLVICATTPAAAQDSELIGYTSVVRNGAAGVLVFNEDCDNAFPGDPGPNATNCVAPSIVGTVISGTVITLIDQSGKTGTPANLTCDGWASAAATVTGLTANDRGMFMPAACNGGRNIACCTPSAP